MLFEEFQDGLHGSHLRYQKRMILAILNLCVIMMPPITFQLNQNGTVLAILNLRVATMPFTKFQLNPTYGSGDVKNVKS